LGAKRNLGLTARRGNAEGFQASLKFTWVFPGDSPDAPILGTSPDRQYEEVYDDNAEMVQGNSSLTCLGQAGALAFTIMKTTSHSGVTVSQPPVT
jgi:hypothetical protein